MELKDVVLETINEIEHLVDEKGFKDIRLTFNEGEVEFLIAFKERIFVLFEGLKSEKLEDYTRENKDIVLGFLQFQLALIDSRLEAINKRNKAQENKISES